MGGVFNKIFNLFILTEFLDCSESFNFFNFLFLSLFITKSTLSFDEIIIVILLSSFAKSFKSVESSKSERFSFL